MQDEVRRLCRAGDGGHKTGIPFVTAWRFAGGQIQMPSGETPYLYLVLGGVLRLYTPSGILDYMPGQYSVSKIDTPLSGTVLDASPQGDFLAISAAFTIHDVVQTLLALDNGLTEQIVEGRMEERDRSRSDQAVLHSVSRFFSARDQAVPSEFLWKNILQEVIYHVLCGSCGKQLIQSMAQIGQAEEIYRANCWIKEHFRSPFTVEELAEQRNMSVSLFHQKFKSAVGMGPLQCQKRLRLTEARRLMLDECKNVTEAALAVGYESLSQFIRDYRKMFGAAPKEDLRRIQRRLEK